MKTLYIRQPSGLGDILFLQKIAKNFISLGFNVKWPVIKPYEYIHEYIKTDGIQFLSFDSLNDKEKELYKENMAIQSEEFIYIPFDRSCQLTGDYKNVMLSKYKLVNMDHSDWQKSVNLVRNFTREQECVDKLNKDNKPYVYVNRIFASPPEMIMCNFSINTELNIIENSQDTINNFRIFDLLSVFENASEIHTVNTSLCYLIEILTTTEKLFMYQRKINNSNQYSTFDYVDGVFDKKWNYME